MKYALILAIIATTLQAAEPPLVFVGKDGKLVYTPHANVNETDKVNVVPNFSYCGYKGGGVKIPDVPVKATIEPREGPARVRIQAAIDEVSKLPLDENGLRGAVLIKAGTYIIGEGRGYGLTIRASGVVLRGEGQGLKGTHLTTGQLGKGSCITVSGDPTFEEGPVSRIADDYVGTGAMTFSVADAQGFAQGDSIRIYFTPNQTWLDNVNRHVGNWNIKTYTIPFERRIAKISGTTITVDTPLVHPLQKRYGGGEVRKITLTKGARLENVGIENLSLSCPDGKADKNRINDTIVFNNVENGWISGVTGFHQCDSLLTLNGSRYITVQDCASLKPIGPKRGGYRYTYYIGGGSNHCLVQRCYAYDGRHDFVTYAYSPGANVFLDCLTQKGGTQGPHQRWSSGILFDNIEGGGVAVSEHRGGSGSGHGWTGVSDVGWNVKSPVVCDAPEGFQNYVFGGTGQERKGSYVKADGKSVFRGHFENHGTLIKPRSLYLKQLEDRLGRQAVEKVTLEWQRGDTSASFYPSLPQFGAPVMHIFDVPVEVTISCPLKNVTIRYTTDGSDPTLESPLYTPPLMIDKPCTIKAMALDAAFRSSPIASARVDDALPSVKPTISSDAAAADVVRQGDHEQIEAEVEVDDDGVEAVDQPVAIGLASNQSGRSHGVHIFGKFATVTITYPFARATIRYTTDGSDPTPQSPLYTAPLKVEADCLIKAIALDKNARCSEVTQATAWVALKPVEAAAAEPGLLRCRYYEGKWPSGKVLPDFTTLTPKSESVEAGVVMPQNRARDYFALLFTGYIEVPVDGVYTFFTEANDGANLLIGKRLVVDNTVGSEGSVGLYAGRHPIEVQYWEKAHDERLRVFWSGPRFERIELPASALLYRKPPAEEALPTTAPSISPSPVHLFGKQTAKMTITYPFEGATIRYTKDGSDPTATSPVYADPLTIDRNCTIKAIAFDRNARASAVAHAQAWVALKPVGAVTTEPGLWCQYYESLGWGADMVPDLASLQSKSESVVAGVAFPENLTRYHWGIRLTGYLDVPKDGVYTFTIEADEGASLVIGDRPIVAHSGTGSMGLLAGRHPIEIKYYQRKGAWYLRAFWLGPGIERSPLPPSVLSHRKQ